MAGLYYLHADHLGHPQFATDNTGAVVSDIGEGVTPFGDSVNLTGAFAQRLMFPGQYADVETGGEGDDVTLSHNWHRTYDPTLGRYLQSDPIGLAGGLNRYAYVGGNPVNSVDPDGQLAFLVAPIIIGFASGVISDFVFQMIEHKGDVRCVDVRSLLLSGGLGALGGGPSGAVAVPSGGSLSAGMSEANRQFSDNVAGIFATGALNAVVGGETALIGGTLAAADGQLSLDTGSLRTEDLFDTDTSTSAGFSIVGGTEGGISSVGGNFATATREGETRATITSGDIVVRDLTDEETTDLLASVNRDVSTTQVITRDSSFDTGNVNVNVAVISEISGNLATIREVRETLNNENIPEELVGGTDTQLDFYARARLMGRSDASILEAMESETFERFANVSDNWSAALEHYGSSGNVPEGIRQAIATGQEFSILIDPETGQPTALIDGCETSGAAGCRFVVDTGREFVDIIADQQLELLNLQEQYADYQSRYATREAEVRRALPLTEEFPGQNEEILQTLLEMEFGAELLQIQAGVQLSLGVIALCAVDENGHSTATAVLDEIFNDFGSSLWNVGVNETGLGRALSFNRAGDLFAENADVEASRTGTDGNPELDRSTSLNEILNGIEDEGDRQLLLLTATSTFADILDGATRGDAINERRPISGRFFNSGYGDVRDIIVEGRAITPLSQLLTSSAGMNMNLVRANNDVEFLLSPTCQGVGNDLRPNFLPFSGRVI